MYDLRFFCYSKQACSIWTSVPIVLRSRRFIRSEDVPAIPKRAAHVVRTLQDSCGHIEYQGVQYAPRRNGHASLERLIAREKRRILTAAALRHQLEHGYDSLFLHLCSIVALESLILLEAILRICNLRKPKPFSTRHLKSTLGQPL